MAVRMPATTFAVAHLVFPYLLVNMILSTPSYSPEKIGASMMIAEHIRNQLEEDYAADQISIKEYVDPFTGDKNKKA